jgi:hypothetical protein
MANPKNGHDNDSRIDTMCAGCDLPFPVNDLGLCNECFAKLERDLIRGRDWDYSATAFGTPQEQLEALRERVIRDYGAAYELISPPGMQERWKRKNKRARSRETKRKREIAARAVRDYSTEDVVQAAHNFLREQNEEWVNTSHLMQHLYETFYKLKPKRLGQPGKKYKSLLKFLEDHLSDFELRADVNKRGVYWIRLPEAEGLSAHRNMSSCHD